MASPLSPQQLPFHTNLKLLKEMCDVFRRTLRSDEDRVALLEIFQSELLRDNEEDEEDEDDDTVNHEDDGYNIVPSHPLSIQGPNSIVTMTSPLPHSQSPSHGAPMSPKSPSSAMRGEAVLNHFVHKSAYVKDLEEKCELMKAIIEDQEREIEELLAKVSDLEGYEEDIIRQTVIKLEKRMLTDKKAETSAEVKRLTTENASLVKTGEALRQNLLMLLDKDKDLREENVRMRQLLEVDPLDSAMTAIRRYRADIIDANMTLEKVAQLTGREDMINAAVEIRKEVTNIRERIQSLIHEHEKSLQLN